MCDGNIMWPPRIPISNLKENSIYCEKSIQNETLIYQMIVRRRRITIEFLVMLHGVVHVESKETNNSCNFVIISIRKRKIVQSS